MSHVQMLLRILADGKPRPISQMVAETGLTTAQIQAAMKVLRKRKAMEAAERPHQITKDGVKWLAEQAARAIRVAARKERKPKRTEEEIRAALKARRLHDTEVRRQRNAKAKAEAANGYAKLGFVHKRVDAPAVADSIVNTAVQSRPALQAAWGVLA